MNKSIISNERYCLVCGSPIQPLKVRIFRKNAYEKELSNKYGCWCYLCSRHHDMSVDGVFFNKILDLKLKQQCQKAWEFKYGNREEFIKIFGRSYI